MNVIINNFDFWNMESMRYYAPPSSWDNERKRRNAESKIFSGEWIASRKRDGTWMMFIKDMDGNLYLRPRAKNTKGEFVNKIDWVPHLHSFFHRVEPGTVFLGELYAPWNEQAKTTTSIMNCLLPKALKRQESEDKKLHYYIFDVLAWGGKLWLDKPAKERFNELIIGRRIYGEHYHEWAQYFYGKELWNQLQSILAEGGEGMVITNEDAKYEPGKRSNRVSLKIKKELQDTIDCFIIGANPPSQIYNGKEIESWMYWFDERNNKKITATDYLNQFHETVYKSYVEGAPVIPVTKNWFYGWAGSLKLGAMKDGKIVHIGNLSGITDETKENWKELVGTVCEITAMEIMTGENGEKGLRHSKFLNYRSDITKEDCDWYKIFGE